MRCHVRVNDISEDKPLDFALLFSVENKSVYLFMKGEHVLKLCEFTAALSD